MSSDHLSFNQTCDSEDDGARWEAYLALLRRTGANPPASESKDELADASEPLPPVGLAASEGRDAENGATDSRRPTPPGAVSFRLGSALVGATIGLAAGFVLAGAALIQVHENAPAPTRTAPARTEPIAHAHEGWTRLAAESGPPSLSGGNSASARPMPARLVSAPSPHHHPKLKHLARRAHGCRHCHGDLRGSHTIAEAARWQTPWSR
jgi:hypothetical protein